MLNESYDFSEELLIGFGDVVDRIVCTHVGMAPTLQKGRDGPVLDRYKWMRVYDEARSRYGRPLTLLAAETLKKNVGEGDYVVLATNSVEMDGPPGAAAMARALIIGLGAVPIIVANHEKGGKSEKCLLQTCIGAQLNPVTSIKELYEEIWSPYKVLIMNWPKNSVADATEDSKKFIDKFRPKAIIAIEAVSVNKKGVRHGALGNASNRGDPDEKIVRWNPLIDTAKEKGILTISTGDNGNEVGFGAIEDICKKHHKFCADCGCPCGGGIVSASKADVVVPATSSNWGSYGIEACLARILGKPEVMHNEHTHNRILLNCANSGIPDGASAMVTPTTDGTSHETCVYTVGQLRQTVMMNSVELVRKVREKPL